MIVKSAWISWPTDLYATLSVPVLFRLQYSWNVSGISPAISRSLCDVLTSVSLLNAMRMRMLICRCDVGLLCVVLGLLLFANADYSLTSCEITGCVLIRIVSVVKEVIRPGINP